MLTHTALRTLQSLSVRNDTLTVHDDQKRNDRHYIERANSGHEVQPPSIEAQAFHKQRILLVQDLDSTNSPPQSLQQ
jgi:hypothetical protein